MCKGCGVAGHSGMLNLCSNKDMMLAMGMCEGRGDEGSESYPKTQKGKRGGEVKRRVGKNGQVD